MESPWTCILKTHLYKRKIRLEQDRKCEDEQRCGHHMTEDKDLNKGRYIGKLERRGRLWEMQ